MNTPIVPRGRYVLRLEDPLLLPKPLYLNLNRSPITIGLCEGDDSDAVIPWEGMRLVLDHEVDQTENQTEQGMPLSSNMFICRSSGECALRLDYEDGFWKATPGPRIHLKEDSMLVRRPSVIRLDEVSSFTLRFSCHGHYAIGCSKSYDNILRFTLVDKQHVALENVDGRGPSSPLLSLPTELLHMVLSDLDRKDLFNFLMVQPSRQPDVCFKPKSLLINPSSLDSIRLCLLASPNSVEEFECLNTAAVPANMKNVVHSACWTKNLSSNRLKSLSIDDFSILKGIRLSSTLTTLRILGTAFGPPFETRKRDLTRISLPASVTNVYLYLGWESCGDFGSHEGEIASGIFHLLPALKTLVIHSCPSEDFWRKVPTSVFESIVHLRLYTKQTSYFPFSLTSNLETLIFHGGDEHFQSMIRKNSSFTTLTALSLRGRKFQALKSILNSASFAAPKLRYISFEKLREPCITALDADFLAKFVYFRVRDYVWRENLIALRQLLTRVKCFEFITKTLSVADEDQNILSLRHEVEKVGGHVEIVDCDAYQFYAHYWTKFKVHVRVFCDPFFDFEKLSKEHPLLFD